MPEPNPSSIEFTEDMKGFAVLGDSTDYKDCYQRGKEADTRLMFHLTIKVEDTELFVRDPRQAGTAEGYVKYFPYGDQELPVEKGIFNCFVNTEAEEPNVKNMIYHLWFRDPQDNPLTFSGFKVVKDNGVHNIWRDTSTLHTRILEGHCELDERDSAKVLAAGILRILPLDFAKQMTTFRAHGDTPAAQAQALADFGGLFLGTLWDVYHPKVGAFDTHKGNKREIPIFTLEGVRDAEVTTHHFSTADQIGLHAFRFKRAPSDDVVLLLHGLTTSTDMFVMPEHYNIVNYLHDNGFGDVWSFDWRGSMRYSYGLFPGRFTLDDIALFDMPAAINEIRRHVGPDARIHVICHCVGSVTFMMSLFAGMVEGISSVISNSVSLTPTVSGWSKVKLTFAPFLMNWILRFPNLNPRWAHLPGPGVPQGKLLAKGVSLFHRECDVPACHMVSFMWGDGRPGCFMHENIDEVTHRRLGDLFGAINVNYYLHIRKMVRRGVAVKMLPEDPTYDQLPNQYLDRIKDVELPPILFLSGEHNRVFPGSNQLTFDTLNDLLPANRNQMKTLSGYGHQDPFMGKRNHEDVFPLLAEFIKSATDAKTLAAVS